MHLLWCLWTCRDRVKVCVDQRCFPLSVKALSHNIMTGKVQNAASANCYFKGKGNRPLLAPTMVHIFAQWGSLMCEQGSGRAVNRAFYEAVRGELGCQWRGLSHICHVATLGPACLFWWQQETAGLVYTGYMSSRRAWACIRTTGVGQEQLELLVTEWCLAPETVCRILHIRKLKEIAFDGLGAFKCAFFLQTMLKYWWCNLESMW